MKGYMSICSPAWCSPSFSLWTLRLGYFFLQHLVCGLCVHAWLALNDRTPLTVCVCVCVRVCVKERDSGIALGCIMDVCE